MKLWPVMPSKQTVEKTLAGMLEELNQLGEIHLTTIQGQWWCYFDIKRGAASLKVKGDRKPEWTVYDAVRDCYDKVKALRL